MNYNAVFMLTGLSLIKKIKLFNSKARNILCLTGDTRYCTFHMDLIHLRRYCCCKSALVRITKEHLERLSCIIETYTPVLFLHFMCSNRWCELKL